VGFLRNDSLCFENITKLAYFHKIYFRFSRTLPLQVTLKPRQKGDTFKKAKKLYPQTTLGCTFKGGYKTTELSEKKSVSPTNQVIDNVISHTAITKTKKNTFPAVKDSNNNLITGYRVKETRKRVFLKK
jgi:hypothetical protein